MSKRETVNHISIVETRNGNSTIQIQGNDGSVKTLHSLYDPEAEAKSMAEAFQFDGRGVIIVLGLGLGYHVAALSEKYPETQIVVVEALPEIYNLAIGQYPGLKDKAEFITGKSPDDALREISGCQMRNGIKPLALFTLSPAVSAFPDYYQPISSSLKKTVTVKLWDSLRYPKFGKDAVNVLLIDSGYFLVREAEKTLGLLGHNVMKMSVGKDTDSRALISKLIRSIIDFRPDFILTINHLGFDEEGALTSFLRSIELPAASWYVDSPRLIVQAFEKNVSPYVSMFLWDREYIGQIRSSGFESVEYMPLAADEGGFRPLKLKQHVSQKYRTDVSFVGNSLVDSTREKFERIPAEFHPAIEKIALKINGERMSFPDAVREEPDGYGCLTHRQRSDFEAAVLWKATLLYRLSCIKRLESFNPRIYGDDGWRKLLNGNFRIKPPLNYYNELPLLYNSCGINFNATHLQMGEAVNQRVFDVPACGAFLLTDYQKSLDELFEIGKEIITYKNIDELPELVKYYLSNPREREEIAGKGRERVLKEHTYRHRLEELVRLMKKRYK